MAKFLSAALQLSCFLSTVLGLLAFLLIVRDVRRFVISGLRSRPVTDHCGDLLRLGKSLAWVGMIVSFCAMTVTERGLVGKAIQRGSLMFLCYALAATAVFAYGQIIRVWLFARSDSRSYTKERDLVRSALRNSFWAAGIASVVFISLN